jgi:hypothetical protein
MIKKQDFSKNMELYVGNKIIKAEPMTKFDYNILRGKDIPGDDQDGYCVGYFDSMDKTDEEPNYYSWSPKAQFEESYRKTTGLNFGIALELMKNGFKVARQGWNGKGLWIVISQGYKNLETDKVWNKDNKKVAELNGGKIDILPYISMKTVDNSIMIGWTPNQLDLLSEDWVIVK